MANITLNIEECNTITPVNYGALYNWPAATDVRKITSSDDWVIPTLDNMNSLIQYLSVTYSTALDIYADEFGSGKDMYYTDNVSVFALRETGSVHWNNNTDATNATSFNARGAGYRTYLGAFSSLNEYAGFAISDFYASAWQFSLYIGGGSNATPTTPNSYIDELFTTYQRQIVGQSIRLLYTGAGTPTTYTGNDGKIYRVVQIGTQYWLADNLNETKYRNGDWITGFDGGVYTPISNANWAALITEGMCYYNDDENNG